MKKLLLMIVAIFMAVAVSAQTNKKVVYLKNGTVVRGVVIDQVPGQSIKVRTADGSVFMYTMGEIERMEREDIIDPEVERKSSGIKKGWHGIFDLSGGMMLDSDGQRFNVGATFSYGYNFSSTYFLGLGAGFYQCGSTEAGLVGYDSVSPYMVPVFANFKVLFNDKKVSPFVNIKVGINIDSYIYHYISPSFGYRFKIGKQTGFNLGLEYTNTNFWSGEEEENCSFINLKLGIDF